MRGDDDGKREKGTGTVDSGQGDSQRGDLERGFGRWHNCSRTWGRGDVGTWAARGQSVELEQRPERDLSGELERDFDRYAAVREEEKKTMTLFWKRVVACRPKTRGTPASMYMTARNRKQEPNQSKQGKAKQSKARPKRKQEPNKHKPLLARSILPRPLAPSVHSW